jgi:hypothetical protein
MAIDQKVLIEYSDKAEAMFNKLAKPSEFSSLKKNKVALSSEERDEVMKRKAIWHHGPNGEPSPAVWKSINPMTKKVTYVTNTHRAYNTASTLKG